MQQVFVFWLDIGRKTRSGTKLGLPFKNPPNGLGLQAATHFKVNKV